MPGCPIRKSGDQRSFAPSPGLSQLITSFFACESLGIRHTPFSTFARTGPATQARLIILSALILYHFPYIIFNFQLSIINYIKEWRFALHFAFANNMSKIRGIYHLIIFHFPFQCSMFNGQRLKWKPEGLDLSAGPVPVFPIYIIYRDQRIAAP